MKLSRRLSDQVGDNSLMFADNLKVFFLVQYV